MIDRDTIIRMFHEAGESAGWKPGIGNQLVTNYLTHFAALVADAERERIAQEFDRRAVYSDGTPSSGWYEPHEPAEIVRGMK